MNIEVLDDTVGEVERSESYAVVPGSPRSVFYGVQSVEESVGVNPGTVAEDEGGGSEELNAYRIGVVVSPVGAEFFRCFENAPRPGPTNHSRDTQQGDPYLGEPAFQPRRPSWVRVPYGVSVCFNPRGDALADRFELPGDVLIPLKLDQLPARQCPFHPKVNRSSPKRTVNTRVQSSEGHGSERRKLRRGIILPAPCAG